MLLSCNWHVLSYCALLVKRAWAKSLHRWVFIWLDKGSQRCSSGLSSRAYTFSCIDDVDLEVEDDILKFADDTKLYGIAESMQKDLNGLIRWTSQWQMKFNVDKCSVMHIGTRNMQYVNGQVLQQVDAQSDLGVVIRKDLQIWSVCKSIYQSYIWTKTLLFYCIKLWLDRT